MAVVQLADIIDVTVFQDLPSVNGVEKTELWQSGIVTSSPLLSTLAGESGTLAELPFWNDLDDTVETNYSNDVPGTAAVPQKVAQGKQLTRKAFMNQGWSSTDLATELAMGASPMEHIRARTDRYFARQNQARLIGSLNGVLADNVANDAGDMVHDVAVEIVGSQTAATKFSHDNFVDAAYTMGDMTDGITAIVVHSKVASDIAKLNGAEDVRDSDGNLLYRSYLGRRIIVDDSMPVVAGATSGFKYTSVLLGAGAFGFGTAAAPVPVEVWRNPQGGNGGGVDELWLRNTQILHPSGFQMLTTPAGQSFNHAELATAAVWDRVVDRKLVPVAYLITN